MKIEKDDTILFRDKSYKRLWRSSHHCLQKAYPTLTSTLPMIHTTLSQWRVLYNRPKQLRTKASVISSHHYLTLMVILLDFIQKFAKRTRVIYYKELAKEFKPTTILSYIEGVWEVLCRSLQQKHLEHLRTVFKSDATFRCHVVRPKDALEPTKENGVVFKIPCECDRVYIGGTKVV